MGEVGVAFVKVVVIVSVVVVVVFLVVLVVFAVAVVVVVVVGWFVSGIICPGIVVKDGFVVIVVEEVATKVNDVEEI